MKPNLQRKLVPGLVIVALFTVGIQGVPPTAGEEDQDEFLQKARYPCKGVQHGFVTDDGVANLVPVPGLGPGSGLLLRNAPYEEGGEIRYLGPAPPPVGGFRHEITGYTQNLDCGFGVGSACVGQPLPAGEVPNPLVTSCLPYIEIDRDVASPLALHDCDGFVGSVKVPTEDAAEAGIIDWLAFTSGSAQGGVADLGIETYECEKVSYPGSPPGMYFSAAVLFLYADVVPRTSGWELPGSTSYHLELVMTDDEGLSDYFVTQRYDSEEAEVDRTFPPTAPGTSAESWVWEADSQYLIINFTRILVPDGTLHGGGQFNRHFWTDSFGPAYFRNDIHQGDTFYGGWGLAGGSVFHDDVDEWSEALAGRQNAALLGHAVHDMDLDFGTVGVPFCFGTPPGSSCTGE